MSASLIIIESTYNDIGQLVFCRRHYNQLRDILELTIINQAGGDLDCECCEDESLVNEYFYQFNQNEANIND